MYSLVLGGNQFQAGLQTTLFFLCAVVLRFYFGPLADSKGKKLVLLIGAASFAIAPVLFYLSKTFWMLTAARVFQAVGLAAFFASGGALVADMAPRGKIATYMGGYRLVNTMGMMIGPAIALWMVEVHTFQQWFLISGIIGIMAFLLMVLINVPKAIAVGVDNQQTSFMAKIKDVLSKKQLVPIYCGIALTAACYGSIFTFAPILLSEMNIITNPGIYFTYFGLAGIVANVLVGYWGDKLGAASIAWPNVIAIGLGAVLLFWTQSNSYWVVVLSGVLAGFGFAGGLLAFISWLVEVTDQQVRASALAVQESTIDLSVALGSLFFGVVSGWITMGNSFLLLGIIVIMPALLFITKKRVDI